MHNLLTISHYQIDTNEDASSEQVKLLGKSFFDYTKPTGLISILINSFLYNSEDTYILDFFSGSSTTAHSVMNTNYKNNKKNKFIMIQLPEPCEEKTEAFKDGYKTIAEIGKERIRRAAKKIKEENPNYNGDLGFKVFKLDSSNICAWQPDANDLAGTLQEYADHIVAGRSEQDILYELLLKRGVDLTVPIEEQTIANKTVYSIGYGVLFVCLDKSISQEEIETLAMGIIKWHEALNPVGETQVVFRDSAFSNDVAKTNMTAILEQNNIAHVRSL